MKGLLLLFLINLFGCVYALWPLPQTITSKGNLSLPLHPSFTFQFISQSRLTSERLSRAIDRYVALIGASSHSRNTENSYISSCSISVESILDADAEFASLKPGADESYELSVTSDGKCSISSQTIWGSMYAMETFTQLLTRESSSVFCNSLPIEIADHSRFTHRGMLIDSSRHYLPMSELKRIVDTFPMSKFNVLHWHAVDAQSFPLNLPTSSQLAKGAYAPSLVYTADDLKSMVAYAADRGVRVLLEVDVPGHAASWQYGEPSLMADCLTYYTNINNFALNPTLPATYDVLKSVVSDILAATGASYFHLGGDEVVYGCWKNDASISAWMNANKITSYDSLLSYFVLQADEITRSLGATPIHWEEVFKAGVKVNKDTIFEIWTNSSQVQSVVAAGYQAITAPSDYWYLDHLTTTWTTMYGYNPTAGLTSAQASLIVGGEVGMWGEYVDEANFESVVYPRAFAVGERLWSAATVTDATSAKPRLLEQRCRMVQRGYRSAPVEPGFCAVQYV